MSFYRPPLNRELVYNAPYVSPKSLPAMYNPTARDPNRFLNTIRCTRYATERTRMPKAEDCVSCNRQQPFFYKGNNYLNAKGTNYRDVRFTGDFDHEFYHGCLDPRDAYFDSFAGVHCAERCAGKPEAKAPCCLTLDLNVLDETECEQRRKAEAEAKAFAATPEGIAAAAAAKQPPANYPPLPTGATLTYPYGAPVFMRAANSKTGAAVELIQ